MTLPDHRGGMQQKYVGLVPAARPRAGDLTFEVGLLIAAVLYAALVKVLPPRTTTEAGEAASATPSHAHG